MKGSDEMSKKVVDFKKRVLESKKGVKERGEVRVVCKLSYELDNIGKKGSIYVREEFLGDEISRLLRCSMTLGKYKVESRGLSIKNTEKVRNVDVHIKVGENTIKYREDGQLVHVVKKDNILDVYKYYKYKYDRLRYISKINIDEDIRDYKHIQRMKDITKTLGYSDDLEEYILRREEIIRGMLEFIERRYDQRYREIDVYTMHEGNFLIKYGISKERDGYRIHIDGGDVLDSGISTLYECRKRVKRVSKIAYKNTLKR